MTLCIDVFSKYRSFKEWEANGGELLEEDCWANKPAERVSALEGKGAHADLFILSWISRQW